MLAALYASVIFGNAFLLFLVRHAADLARGRLTDATEPVEIPPGLRPWRDDYSSLFSVLRTPAKDA